MNPGACHSKKPYIHYKRHNYERALLTLNAQQELISQGIGAVSKVNHEEIKIDVEQLVKDYNLLPDEDPTNPEEDNQLKMKESGDNTIMYQLRLRER